MDDIFLLWIGALDELNKFLAKINQVHLSIKLYVSYSSNSVNFLDTTIKKSSTGALSTTLFKKETGCQDYLYRKSEYPESLKRSMQAVRLKGTCTEYRDFKANCSKRLTYSTIYHKHLTEEGKT